ncbi:MAG: DUF3298 domain-containing protein [candidate division WOR-3 bacterium]
MANKNIMFFCIILCFIDNLNARESNYRNHYWGIIGRNHKIYMELKIEKDSVNGYYFYYKINKYIQLKGNINQDKSFKICEYANGNLTGIFKGSLKDSNKLTGEWSNPDGKKKFPYNLKLIAQEKEFKSEHYDVCVKYPKFYIDNKKLEEMLNETLRNRALSRYNDFIASIDESAGLETSPPEYSEDYNIEYFSNEIISLSFISYSYYPGAAHGYTDYPTLNILLTSEIIKEIELGDLFVLNSNYLKIISDICIRSLKKQGASFVVEGEIKDVSELLDNFVITPSGLEFIFSPYTVGPYVEGYYTVEIPYKDLKNIIDLNSPLSKIIIF